MTLAVRATGTAGKDWRKYQGKVATVLRDPSIDASHIEIDRTLTAVLKITGTGFQQKIRPIVDFEPPLAMGNLHLHVRNGVIQCCARVDNASFATDFPFVSSSVPVDVRTEKTTCLTFSQLSVHFRMCAATDREKQSSIDGQPQPGLLAGQMADGLQDKPVPTGVSV